MFIAGIATILAAYPPELHAIAVQPAGIPKRVKVLRNLAEIDEACRELNAPIVRQLEREAAQRRPLAIAHAPRAPRTPEQQAEIDAQVARVRRSIGLA